MKEKTLILVLLFSFGLVKSLFFSQFGFSLTDEGETLHNGLRILNGELPYRDFFTLLPPLDAGWATLAFKLFGISIFAPRLLSSIVFAFLLPIFFLLARRSLPTIYALIPPILLVFLDLNIERLYFFTFLFGALTFFVYSLKSRVLFAILGGLLLGFGALMRLDLAIGFLLGIFLSIIVKTIIVWRDKKKVVWTNKILGFSAGFATPVVLLLGWLVKNDLWGSFAQAFFITSLKVTAEYDLPFPSLSLLVPQDFAVAGLQTTYTAWFAYIIVACYLGFLLYLVTNWKQIWFVHFELGILFLIGIFISPYALGRTDFGHLVKGGMPFLFLGTFLVSKLIEKKDTLPQKIGCLLLGIPILIVVAGIIQSIWWIRFNDTKISFARGTVYLNSKYIPGSTLVSAKTIAGATEFIETNNGNNEPFLAVPYMAGLYFLSGTTSRTYFDNIFAGYLPTSDDEKKFIYALDRIGINLVVYDPLHGPTGKRQKMAEYNSLVHTYIMDNFEVVNETPEGWLLMKKLQ